MASSINQLFCVQAQDLNSRRNIYMNYISDPAQKTSLKLPEFIIGSSVGTRDVFWQEQLANITLNRKEMRASIMGYLVAMYGDNMPKFHRTPDNCDLVIDIYIHPEHSKARKELAKREPYKLHCLRLVFTTIQQRVLELASKFEGFERRTISGPFLKAYQADLMKKGQVASETDICLFLLDQNSCEQPVVKPEEAAKVGENLLTFACKGKSSERSVYFNVIADSSPESIRWPKAMVGPRGPFPEVDFDVAMVHNINYIVDYSVDCLEDYHDKHGLTVHLAKNSKDLIFTIPVHINLVPTFKILLAETLLKEELSRAVCDFYQFHFWALEHHNNPLKYPPRLELLNGHLEHQPTGREATEEEINSLMQLEGHCQSQGGESMFSDRESYTNFPDRLWTIS